MELKESLTESNPTKTEAVRYQILRDLKTDSFIGPGDQGDGFVVHVKSRFRITVAHLRGSVKRPMKSMRRKFRLFKIDRIKISKEPRLFCLPAQPFARPCA
jgi:hypothetical protein